MEVFETDRNWKRRAVSVPVWFASLTFLTVLLPVLLPVAVLADLLRRRPSAMARTYVFFTWFFATECFGLVGAAALWLARPLVRDEAWYRLANRKLQRIWARGLFWGAVRIYGIRLSIDGLEALEDERPALVLSRHASTLDTMIPLAIVRQLKRFGYVIKAELLMDPALDIVAQRFPNAFVRRGGPDPEREIAKVLELGRDLGPGAAVVVYPEGTRFSEEKRAQLLEKFEACGDDERLAIARRLKRTLPPLREGGMRLIEEMREADLVIVAHRGIDRGSSMAALFAGGMTHAGLDIAIWRIPAVEVPREREKIQAYLVDIWAEVDRFACGEARSAADLRAEGRKDERRLRTGPPLVSR